MSVDTTHPDYDNNKDRWELVRSVLDSDATKYIRKIEVGNDERNISYKQYAQLVNFTSRTVDALVGSVFRKAPEVVLPTALEYLIDDATGGGLSLNQLAQEAVVEVLSVGRYGLLSDYPTTESGLTSAQVSAMSLAARIYQYKTESIINWQTLQMNGLNVLSMVVLKENVEVMGEDGFTRLFVDQYRVLRLVDGYYEQHLYNDAGDLIDILQPKKGDGSYFTYIPFRIVGSESNRMAISKPPVYDLANLNLGHYRNSADLEENLFKHGQSTLILASNLSQAEFDQANPQGAVIGASKGLNLGEGGNAFLLQTAANQVVSVEMQRKEEQAIMTGARLITPQSGVETAEAARLRYSSETSVLSTVVNNCSDAIMSALSDCADFMNVSDEEIVYELNTTFYDRSMDPQLLMTQIQLLDRGIIAESDLRSNIRQAGMIESDRTDDDIAGEVGDVSPIE